MPKLRLSRNKHLPHRWRNRSGKFWYRVPPGMEAMWEGKTEYLLGSTFNEAVDTYNKMVALVDTVSEPTDLVSHADILAASIPFPKSCVYFLINGLEIVYIGQSRSALKRASNHNDKAFDRIAFIPCDEDQLPWLEAKYINAFKPKYNVYLYDAVGRNGAE